MSTHKSIGLVAIVCLFIGNNVSTDIVVRCTDRNLSALIILYIIKLHFFINIKSVQYIKHILKVFYKDKKITLELKLNFRKKIRVGS